MTPIFRSRRSWLAVTSAVLFACGQDPEPTPSVVAVDLFVDDAGLRITGIYPVAEFPLARARSSRTLRYELQGDGGDVIAAGVVPDFRFAHSEVDEGAGLTQFEVKMTAGGGSLRLPYQDGTLVLFEPGSGAQVELGRARFNPANMALSRAGLQNGRSRHAVYSDADILGPPARMVGALDPAAAVDLLILPEGYKEDELEKFHTDSDGFIAGFLALADYAPYAPRFNVWRQDVRSTDSGIDDPDTGSTGTGTDDPDTSGSKTTAFDFSFGNGDLRRCVFFNTAVGQEKARALGTAAQADVVIVLANTEEHGGCATSGIFSVTRYPDAPETIGHELGHAMLSLADEYDYGACREPNAANVTKEITRATIPWSDLLAASVMLPTPAGTAGVGAFLGGNYCTAGVYRPQEHCLMREYGVGLCAVCRRELDRFFGNFGNPSGPQQDCPATWRGDGICDLCFPLSDPDPDCPADVCDQDGLCETDDGEHCGNCPTDCDVCGGCGDGHCQEGENDQTCGVDCGCGAVGECGSVAPFGCWCDPACAAFGDCCADQADICE